MKYLVAASLLFCGCLAGPSTSPGTGGGNGAGGGSATTCGDGTLNTNEACEGFELRGRTCISEGFERGDLKCTAACTYDYSGCSTCGDGRISGNEKCDPANVDGGPPVVMGQTCASQVDAGAMGQLGCDNTCSTLDKSDCFFLPVRNEPCSLSRGCGTPFVCTYNAQLALRCTLFCPAAEVGTAGSCPSGEQCRDGGFAIQGMDQQPPTLTICSEGCAAGYGCVDAGFTSYCVRTVGLCQ